MLLNAVILFCSCFMVVFFLGLQSLCVNSGRRKLAFLNSFMIGLSNLALYKLTPSAEGIEIVAYLFGGPFGIVTAMWFFDKVKRTSFFTPRHDLSKAPPPVSR